MCVEITWLWWGFSSWAIGAIGSSFDGRLTSCFIRAVDPESARTFSPTRCMPATMAEPAEDAMLPALRSEPESVSSVLELFSFCGSSWEWRLVWIVTFSVERSCLEALRWAFDSELLDVLRSDVNLKHQKMACTSTVWNRIVDIQLMELFK